MISFDEVMEVVDEPTTQIEVSKSKKLEVAREVIPMQELVKMADMLSKSTIVPIMYQNRPENCFVALDMASRMGLSPMIVMQNLFVIQGKPSWSGSAISAMLRSSPQFRNVELNYVGTPGTDSWGAYVSATRVSNGSTLTGATVTIAIAKKEGWEQKAGSKWKTIPELMLAYRAYAWFGRVYAPELTMGLQSVDEVEDITNTEKEANALDPFDGGK